MSPAVIPLPALIDNPVTNPGPVSVKIRLLPGRADTGVMLASVGTDKGAVIRLTVPARLTT